MIAGKTQGGGYTLKLINTLLFIQIEIIGLSRQQRMPGNYIWKQINRNTKKCFPPPYSGIERVKKKKLIPRLIHTGIR